MPHTFFHIIDDLNYFLSNYVPSGDALNAWYSSIYDSFP